VLTRFTVLILLLDGRVRDFLGAMITRKRIEHTDFAILDSSSAKRTIFRKDDASSENDLRTHVESVILGEMDCGGTSWSAGHNPHLERIHDVVAGILDFNESDAAIGSNIPSRDPTPENLVQRTIIDDDRIAFLGRIVLAPDADNRNHHQNH